MSNRIPTSPTVATPAVANVSETATAHPKQSGETLTNFETADLTPIVSEARLFDDMPQVQLPQPSPRKGKRQSTRSAIVIDSSGEQLPEESNWEPVSRGMPSWLTSLIFHLAVILVLALISVSNNGRQIIDMIATATEPVSIEPVVTMDSTFEPQQIEELSEQLQPETMSLTDATDLEPILDESLINTSLESQVSESMFDGLSAAGIPDSAMLPTGAEGSAEFFGVEGAGTDFVFIIDCSGSMADYGRWKRAVRELKDSINNLKSDQRFLILLYNHGFVAMNDSASLVKSTERTRKRVFRWLGQNYPDSWTFCAEALAKALSIKPDAVFLLSDGEFTDRRNVFMVLESMNDRRKLEIEKMRQIPIHTIALGSHDGRYTMKRIANENGGVFKQVD